MPISMPIRICLEKCGKVEGERGDRNLLRKGGNAQRNSLRERGA